MNLGIEIKDVTIAANATVRVACNGSYLLIVSNTSTFQFSIDGGPMQPGLAILEVDFARDKPNPGGVVRQPILSPSFKEIIFKDTSGAANAIRFIVAMSPVRYINPLPTIFAQSAPTYTKGYGALTLAGGASAQYVGVDAGKTRKQIIVTNRDAALELEILDGNPSIGSIVFPQRNWTFESNGTIWVKNNNAGAVDYVVLETFYS